MSDLNFSVELADANSAEAPVKAEDKRGLAERLFTKHDKETGEVATMPIKAINCSLQTPSKQGHGAYQNTNTLPLLINYRGADPEFKGQTKGRDFIIVGKRPGKGGSNGLMIDVNEVDVVIEGLLALKEKLTVAVPQVRAQMGLPVPTPPAVQTPPTEAE